MTVRAPIIIVGTHRSGTSMMGDALGRHPDVAYWAEPRHVWQWGHNYRPNDVLTAEDATPRIRVHVQKTFAAFLARSGRRRFAEKTPSNCLRLPFILEIFPDARFVHIYRDGRAVVRSTQQMTATRGPDAEWFLPRLLGTPVWEWPAFAPRALRTLGGKLSGRGMRFWGPQPPGWRDWLQEDPRHVLLAKQWRDTIEPVLDFRERLPRSQWHEIAYEEFVKRPAEAGREILDFLELPPSREFLEHVRGRTDPSRVGLWREQIDRRTLAELRPFIEPTLRKLGYEW